MKVRVQYTYEIMGEDLAALNIYHHEKVSRDSLRQQLEDLGRGGIEEQICQGRIWLENKPEGE